MKVIQQLLLTLLKKVISSTSTLNMEISVWGVIFPFFVIKYILYIAKISPMWK